MCHRLIIFVHNKKNAIMSEKKMNSYRLTSMEEPTDEMLAQLMKEVAKEAKRKGIEATGRFFDQVDRTVALRKKEWAQRRKQMAK